MTDFETLIERWRGSRSRVEPSAGFADRVMQKIAEEPSAGDISAGVPLAAQNRIRRLARAGAVAAAVLAAVLRVVELVSVFAATGIEN